MVSRKTSETVHKLKYPFVRLVVIFYFLQYVIPSLILGIQQHQTYLYGIFLKLPN